MQYTVLFLCLGNICRSPAAELILKEKLKKLGLQDKVSVKSFGLMDWSRGLPIDPRMQEALEKKGIPIDRTKKAERISLKELKKANIVFVPSHRVIKTLLQEYASEAIGIKAELITSKSKNYHNEPIHDPFAAEDPETFDRVVDVLLDACEGIAQSFLSVSL